MKTFNHKSRSRERVSVPQKSTNRSERRKEAREQATAERKARIAERMKANPRLVRA